jgi:SAM-dependent methyltransferase
MLRRLLPTAHHLALERTVAPALERLQGSIVVIGAGLQPYRTMLKSAASVVLTDVQRGLTNIDIIADAHNLPFENGQFDGVVAVEVFEHLRDPRKAASEVYRVLKSGGGLVMSTPFLFRVHGDPHDYQRFTEGGLRQLLDEFREVKIVPFGGRRHILSDLITTNSRYVVPLRIANHAIASRWWGNRSSRDCPSGYVVEAVK